MYKHICIYSIEKNALKLLNSSAVMLIIQLGHVSVVLVFCMRMYCAGCEQGGGVTFPAVRLLFGFVLPQTTTSETGR
jgi:hypothetical protein